MSVGSRLGVVLLLALTAAVYGLWLGYSPIYMHDAEVLFALPARSIAATLHDTNGRFLPLYFRMPYIAAVVFMPLCLAFTWVYLFARYRRLRFAHLSATVAFAAYRYAITRSGLVIGVLRLLNYDLMQEYASLYWSFHNLSFLFFVGSPNFQSSTRVFLVEPIIEPFGARPTTFVIFERQ